MVPLDSIARILIDRLVQFHGGWAVVEYAKKCGAAKPSEPGIDRGADGEAHRPVTISDRAAPILKTEKKGCPE